MKNLLLFIVLLMSCSTVWAQGIRVVYRENLKIDKQLKGIDDPTIRELVKSKLENMKSETFLICDAGKSLFGNLDTDGNAGVSIKRNTAAIYKDINERKIISQENILDKIFLIEESLQSFNWKLKEENRQIAGYNCKQATIGDSITAWYCPDLPIPNGPYSYWGLPGIILQIDLPSTGLTAQSVEMNYDTSGTIVVPQKGTKITREEFSKIREKKIKNIGDGKTQVKIIRN